MFAKIDEIFQKVLQAKSCFNSPRMDNSHYNKGMQCIDDACKMIRKFRAGRREYEKYEFCDDIGCPGLVNQNCKALDYEFCSSTAKEFHEWLTANGFKLVKMENK